MRRSRISAFLYVCALTLALMAPSLALLGAAPVRAQDATPEYVAWMNDPAVTRFTEARFLEHTPESVREYVRVIRPLLQEDDRWPQALRAVEWAAFSGELLPPGEQALADAVLAEAPGRR